LLECGERIDESPAQTDACFYSACLYSSVNPRGPFFGFIHSWKFCAILLLFLMQVLAIHRRDRHILKVHLREIESGRNQGSGVKCMSFLHQQIQSFINLGICKEYPIMAKPKSPKKNQEAKEKLASAVPPPVSEAGVVPAEPVVTQLSAAPVSVSEPKKSVVRKSTRKPEIVKSESRSNLVPINIEDEIRQLAYLFSERRGFVPGHEAEDWLAAEHEVMQRYHHHQSA
jgi:hypothetical protein